jgi:two-component system CheB/CheR fusion protein
VLPVVDMPQKLIELWENARVIELPPSGDGEEPIAHSPSRHGRTGRGSPAARRSSMLLTRTGHDFKQYKRATVLRRIERRMQVRAVHTLPDYRELLEADARECTALLDDMLIGVTNFFRDREAFEAVEREIIPELFKDKGSTDEVRVWVAACSTGEEAYSLAMLLADHAADMPQPPPFQVFASDIDNGAIAQAGPATTRPRSSPTSRRRACAATSPRTTTATTSASRSATASCSPRTTCCAIRRSRGSTWCPAATC